MELMSQSVVAYDTLNNDFTPKFKIELKEILNDVTVISLGENSHEDGATFKFRNELIKFLHNELNFEVLASEYGFYGNFKRNDALKNGIDLRNKLRTASWIAKSAYGFTVYDYMSKSWNTEKPLIYAGYDKEKVPDGIPNIKKLLNEIQEGIDYNISEHDDKVLDSLIVSVYSGIGNTFKQNLSMDGRNRAKEIIKEMLSETESHRKKLSNTLGNEKTLIYNLTLKSILMSEKEVFAGSFANIVRDKHMAERVFWLTDSIYKGKKIILMGASGHFAKNTVQISRSLEPESYGFYPFYQMGDHLENHYGDKYYSMVFTSGSGENGLILPNDHKFKKFETIRKIEGFQPQGFENLAMKTKYYTLFTDLRNSQSESWLSGEFTAYPFGYNEDYAKWKNIVDGIFFIREMFPDKWHNSSD